MAHWEEAAHKIAVSIIIERQSRILLLKEQEGYWQPPGGGVDEGESPQEALFRELKEETGNIQVYEPVYPVDIRMGFHRVKLVGIAFAAKYASGDVTLSEENSDFGWFTLKEIKDKALALSIPFEVLQKGVNILKRLES